MKQYTYSIIFIFLICIQNGFAFDCVFQVGFPIQTYNLTLLTNTNSDYSVNYEDYTFRLNVCNPTLTVCLHSNTNSPASGPFAGCLFWGNYNEGVSIGNSNNFIATELPIKFFENKGFSLTFEGGDIIGNDIKGTISRSMTINFICDKENIGTPEYLSSNQFGNYEFIWKTNTVC